MREILQGNTREVGMTLTSQTKLYIQVLQIISLESPVFWKERKERVRITHSKYKHVLGQNKNPTYMSESERHF